MPLLRQKTADSSLSPVMPNMMPNTLALEYNRDMEKGLTSVDLPINYFPDDDPTKAPVVTWRSTGQLLYSNWLNFYVYQSTPYDIKDIK